MEFQQIVNVQAYNDAEIGRKVREIKRIAREPTDTGGPPEDDRPTKPPFQPPAPVPYFDIGDASGRPGETVEVDIEAGCQLDMYGFQCAGGVGLQLEDRSGYGKFKARGAYLGPFLGRYLKDQGAIHDEPEHVHDHFFSRFNFYDRDQRALPEEWWFFVVGLLSIDQKRVLDPISIPGGTHLFTVKIEILAGTPSGMYELTCKDEWYFTSSRQRRRKLEWSLGPQGSSKIETFPGKITVR